MHAMRTRFDEVLHAWQSFASRILHDVSNTGTQLRQANLVLRL